MSWNYFARLTDFSVALLFNGPEFEDVAEIAKVTAFHAGGSIVGTLSVDLTGTTSASWLGTGSGVVSNLSPASALGAGAWSVSNPFGNYAINKLEFTALTGPWRRRSLR